MRAGDWAASLTGSVRYGSRTRPQVLERGATFTMKSRRLWPRSIRDINKYSNNVMAQQLYPDTGRGSTGSDAQSPASFAASDALRTEAGGRQRFGASRSAAAGKRLWACHARRRISATAHWASLLQAACAVPDHAGTDGVAAHQPDIDGTLKRSDTSTSATHLKTGSLDNVLARWQVMWLARSGKRYVARGHWSTTPTPAPPVPLSRRCSTGPLTTRTPCKPPKLSAAWPAVLTTVSFIPQAWQTFRTAKT
jgi:D-alanyl-D-alanine carboxypeptidase/D-alanyl-D-alanine-endopeptidase (penicillin-binding protein 4)